MIFLLNLIKIEIKRVLRFLPHIVAGALALCFIIGVISFSASKALYEKKDNNKVNIALSMPENDKSAKFMISIIKEMKSIKESCNFVPVNNKEEAYKMVKDGEAYGAIIIPKGLARDIMDGTNTPATVVLPNNSSIEANLIKDLFDSGVKSLTSAQAGIYAVTYEYEEVYNDRITKELQDNINIKYFDHTLARESYFNHTKISASGELTLIEYYISSGIVFFMLLLGMVFSKALCPSNKAFYEKLKSYNISKAVVTLTRIISVFTVYIIVAVIGFFIYVLICKYLGTDIMVFKIRDYLILMFVIFCVVSYVVCIFTITESQISGSLLLFVSTLIMNFVSGGFIPTVFLPKALQSISPYMLTNVLSKQVGSIFIGEFDGNGFFSACEMLVAVYIVTAIVLAIKGRIVSAGVFDRESKIFKVLDNNFIKIKGLITKKVGK
jgi:ABC-2 type transport system permease protein